MIQKETYTRNNINSDIHEAVILYADREPTEEELYYINTHNFDEAYICREYGMGGCRTRCGRTGRTEYAFFA